MDFHIPNLATVVSIVLLFGIITLWVFKISPPNTKQQSSTTIKGERPTTPLSLPSKEPPIHQFSSRIKEVWIELYNYRFYHSPFSKDVKAKHNFLGRKTAKERIVTLLRESVTSSGAYLVTGFRGMGKTSLVRLAIKEYNDSVKTELIQTPIRSKGETTYRLVSYASISLAGILLVLLCTGTPSINFSPILHTGPYVFELICGCLFLLLFLALASNDVAVKGLGVASSLIFVTWVVTMIPPDRFIEPLFTEDASWLLIVLFSITSLYLFLLSARFLYDLFRLTKNHYHPAPTKESEYQSFEINLSQDEIGEQSILKRLTQELSRYWQEELEEEDFHHFISPIYAPIHWLLNFLGFTAKGISYRTIRSRLSLLEQRLSAEVTAQENTTINPSFATRTGLGLAKVVLPSFDYSKRNQTTFPVASAKEVEDNLIHIFKDIEVFRKENTSIPRFLFIIDELDKIEPNSSTTITDRESSDPIFDRDTSIRGGNRVRERQEAIASLLANLKGFLNVVRAKFIFIGGREMYDASLADIADRDSFYSSIFNDVIYVSSFFKDKNEARAGVTQMTVAYLTQLLLPSHLVEEKGANFQTIASEIQPPALNKNLRFKLHYGGRISRNQSTQPATGNSVFNQMVYPPGFSQQASSDVDDHLFELAKAKVIAILQNYAIYLTYRSNGTPKKLISLIERNIRQESDFKELGDLLVLTQNYTPIESTNQRMFLRLKFDFQYEVGLTANLYRPFIITNSRYLKALGDKLLFSSAFIFDHILKFHPFGFSWRNLELIPEVILINKEPNLRQFIESLIRFLSKQYIRPTVSGIFQYKFFSKTAIELGLVSRISDLGAAAFNFTLDESLQIKRYYKRKLSELQEKYRRKGQIEDRFINAIAFIQTILGDLHYYDKEYDDALIYYTESIQYLRVNDKEDKLTKHEFLIWLRNKLKAGLTLEKMRAFDSVFSYYRTLIIEAPIYLKNITPKEQELPHTAYRSLQLLTKPLVAWLAAIEKQRFDGITAANLEERHADIVSLLMLNGSNKTSYFDPQRQAFLYGDYLNNVGSILFYKNKYFAYLLKGEEFVSNVPRKEIREELRKNTPNHNIDETFFTSSQAAYLHYLKSLKQLLCHFDKEPDLLSQATTLLSSDQAHVISAEKSYYVANVIAKIGDTILATSYQPEATDQTFSITDYASLLATPFSTKFLNQLKKDLAIYQNAFSPALAMRVYLLAYAYFIKAGRSHSAAFQLKKILFCLRDIGSALKPETFKTHKSVNLRMSQLESIALQAFRLISGTGEVANRPQILKYQEILNIATHGKDNFNHEEEETNQRTIIYNLLTTSSETREVIVTVEEIRLRLFKRCRGVFEKSIPKNLSTFLGFSNQFISPYSMINSRFLRLLELKYRCEVLYCYLKDVLQLPSIFEAMEPQKGQKKFIDLIKTKLQDDKITKHIRRLIPAEMGQLLTYEELFIFIITEGIFCTREIIRTINLFSPGYIINYSFLADNHRRMSLWCQAYENLKVILKEDGKEQLRNRLQYIIGNNAISFLEPNYQRELALHNFTKAIEMHTEGRLYKGYVLNTYALEDDFNDNFSHFCAALERYRLNNGSIGTKVKKLKEELKDSKLYEYRSYFPLRRS
ncbi:MAG: P-loop NTPase fold protein [Lewinella sp.]